jgi:hypothetical protein
MRWLSGLILTCLALPAQAANPYEKITSFVDDTTFVVLYTNIGKLDWVDISKRTADIMQVPEADRNEMQKGMKSSQELLQKLKISEFYLIYGSGDFPEVPALIFPTVEGRDAKLMTELFAEVMGGKQTMTLKTIRGFDCLGSAAGLEKIQSRKSVERKDFAKCFDGIEEGAQIGVFCPSDGVRTIFESVAPELPKQLGGGSTKKITRGIDFIRLIADESNPFQLQLDVKANNAETTKFLTGLLDQAKALLPMAPVADETGEKPLKEANPAMLKVWLDLLTPKVEGNQIQMKLNVEKEGKAVMAVFNPTAAAARQQSTNNVKQILLAAHNYESANGKFPGDILDKKTGKPLLSWRVAILPYIEQNALYSNFKLDEPWDSPNNKPFSDMVIKVYRSPFQKKEAHNLTTYQTPVGKKLGWTDTTKKGVRIVDFTDGTSNSILLFETKDEVAVPWAKPADLVIDPKNPAKDWRLIGGKGYILGFADGSVRFGSGKTPALSLYQMLTRDGGEVVKDLE